MIVLILNLPSRVAWVSTHSPLAAPRSASTDCSCVGGPNLSHRHLSLRGKSIKRENKNNLTQVSPLQKNKNKLHQRPVIQFFTFCCCVPFMFPSNLITQASSFHSFPLLFLHFFRKVSSSKIQKAKNTTNHKKKIKKSTSFLQRHNYSCFLSL